MPPEDESVMEIKKALSEVAHSKDPDKATSIPFDEMVELVIGGSASLAYLFPYGNVVSYRNGRQDYFVKSNEGFISVREW